MKKRKLRPVKPSKQAEVYYRRQLSQLIKVMQDIVVSELNNDAVVVNDALFTKGVELLAAQMNRITKRLEEMNINNFASQLAQGFLNRLNRNNQRSMTSNIERTTGVDLKMAVNSSELDQLLNIKIAENVALINSIKNEYIQDVGKVIRDNVLNGERSTRLITEIKERGQVTESRAKLIARTETSKVNAQITQLRAESLGAKTYVWSASMDERTRTDHKAMDGKLCRWDDVTVYSDDDGKTWKKRSSIGGVEINPGEIWNCRCTSMPIVTWG